MAAPNLLKKPIVWIISTIAAITLLTVVTVTGMVAAQDQGEIYACKHERTGIITIKDTPNDCRRRWTNQGQSHFRGHPQWGHQRSLHR